MAIEDRVLIRLKSEEAQAVEGYEVSLGIMTQPGRFSVRLANSRAAKDVLNAYPPGSAFELFVYDGEEKRRQFVGKVDSRGAAGNSSSVLLRGRDKLAEIIGSKASADKRYNGLTYFGLLEAVLKDAGVEADTFDTSENDRKERSGANALRGSEKVKADARARGKKTIVHPPTIKAGEFYWDFLQQHVQKAGLFLFASPNGEIVLTSPDREQPPIYQIRNAPSEADRNEPGSCVDYQFDDDTAGRFSECIVYGRGGTGVTGRTKARQAIADEEMAAYGLFRPNVLRDLRVSSIEEAQFYAQRAISTSRREGWRLEYTLAGHTTQQIGSSKRVVWTPDTMVQVIDEELGFREVMFVESVTFKGDGSRTETVVRLMRKQDLRFLDDPADEEGEG